MVRDHRSASARTPPVLEGLKRLGCGTWGQWSLWLRGNGRAWWLCRLFPTKSHGPVMGGQSSRGVGREQENLEAKSEPA